MKSDCVLVSLELLHNGPSHGVCEMVPGLAFAKGFKVFVTEGRTFETVREMELYHRHIVSSMRSTGGEVSR